MSQAPIPDHDVPDHHDPRNVGRPSRPALARIPRAVARALHGDAGSGLILLGVAALAMALANSPLAPAWHALFHAPLPWSPSPLLPTLAHWIDDGLMAVFFFAVGIEIKREALVGALSDPRARRLPVLAAAAGMALPALIYLGFARADPALHPGWAIPAATDIAFALGVLGLAGRGLPPALRLFLLGIAVVDDLGAVAIIALAYGHGLAIGWAVAAAGVLAALALANRAGVAALPVYLGGAALLWACVLHSGIHATVAGVLAALCVPLRARGPAGKARRSPLLACEHVLAPLCSYAIVPVFGLANAGVDLGAVIRPDIDLRLVLAVAAGLVLGKQVGVMGAVLLAERTGFARRPADTTNRQLWGAGLLAGVGFTMSLFIGALAFPGDPALVETAKLGTLAGSLVAASAGFFVLRGSGAREPG